MSIEQAIDNQNRIVITREIRTHLSHSLKPGKTCQIQMCREQLTQTMLSVPKNYRILLSLAVSDVVIQLSGRFQELKEQVRISVQISKKGDLVFTLTPV